MSDALEELNKLLKQNSELLEAQLKANQLKNEELDLKRKTIEQEQAKIDLEKENQATRKEALRRAEARLHEVLQRYVGLSERVETLIGYTQKILYDDDAFKDILSGLAERFESFERAMMLALIDKLDNPHVQNETNATINKLNEGLIKSSKQRQLVALTKSLLKLEEKLAEGDDSLLVVNKIDKLKGEIQALEKELQD